MPSLARPEPHDPAELVTGDALVVVDTNVLLGLYRLSPGARADTLASLRAVKDRLWLPHQVSVEFWANVEAVRAELPGAYGKLLTAVDDLTKRKDFGDGRRHQESREAVAGAVNEAAAALKAQLQKLRTDDPAIVNPDDDPILAELTELFDGRVGEAPPLATTRARVEDFKTFRAPNLIPPGYKDANTKGTAQRGAGDYLLWAQLLDHAAKTGRPVLLVTDDVKDDWWDRPHGETAGPRPELIREFAERSTSAYGQVDTRRFVDLVGERLGVQAAPSTLDELEEVEADAALAAAVPSFAEWLESVQMRPFEELAAFVAERNTREFHPFAGTDDAFLRAKVANMLGTETSWSTPAPSSGRRTKTPGPEGQAEALGPDGV